MIVSIEPDSSFAGDVELIIESPDDIETIPEKAHITLDKPLDEIEVYIDSTAILGEKEVMITCTHADKQVTASVTIIVYSLFSELLPLVGKGILPPEDLTQWLEETHPEYKINADSSWFSWFEDPNDIMKAGGGVEQRYFNREWEIKRQSAGYGIWIEWYWIRKRGDEEPCLYVREIFGHGEYVFEEITASEFNK